MHKALLAAARAAKESGAKTVLKQKLKVKPTSKSLKGRSLSSR